MDMFEFHNPVRVIFGPDGKLGACVPVAKDDARVVLALAL